MQLFPFLLHNAQVDAQNLGREKLQFCDCYHQSNERRFFELIFEVREKMFIHFRQLNLMMALLGIRVKQLVRLAGVGGALFLLCAAFESTLM